MTILMDGNYSGHSGQNPPTFWKAVLDKLQDLTTPDQFKVWLLPLEVVSYTDGKLTLLVLNPFFKTYVINNFEPSIIDTMEIVTGQRCTITYSIRTAATASTKTSATGLMVDTSIGQTSQLKPSSLGAKSESNNSFRQISMSSLQNTKASPSLSIDSSGRLNPSFSSLVSGSGLIKTPGRYIDTRHTFDNFIVGAGNQFAYAATKGVALSPGGKHNPLLVYGASGLGKTHLLHALAVDVLKRTPSAKICYLPAEQFVNDFIESTKKNAVNLFKSKYRTNFDIFLIDDIQFFAGKGRSQEEFFYTFNHLCESHHQVVMTSDNAPKDLSGLEARLITRLQQGLLVDIKAPDLETRIAILRAKAELDDLYLPEDVCLMIASNIRNSIRELEGALVRLGAEASINGTEITLEMASEALNDMFSAGKGDAVNVDTIKQFVSQYFKITLSEMESKSRARKFAEPRQIAMFLTRKYANKTYPEIASLFGGKDHSTVIHAIRKIEKNMTTSTVLKKQVGEIQQLL